MKTLKDHLANFELEDLFYIDKYEEIGLRDKVIPENLRKDFEREGYNWVTNMNNLEADIIEEACKEEGIDYRRCAAFDIKGQHIPSMAAIFLPERSSLGGIWKKLSEPERIGYIQRKQYSGSLDEVLTVEIHE